MPRTLQITGKQAYNFSIYFLDKLVMVLLKFFLWNSLIDSYFID